MSKLSEIVTKVMEIVPAVDDVPTAGQYQQSVRDAALDFSRRCGLTKFGELSIVSGTATYSLPDDFMKLIMLESLSNPDGLIISDGGLIPVSANWEERYVIVNKQITFKPTPAYSLTRDYQYKSAWIFDSGTDPNLLDAGDEEINIIVLEATALCFQKQANASAGAMTQYSLGAVSVKLGDSSANQSGDAETNEKKYLAACEHYNGTRLAIS